MATDHEDEYRGDPDDAAAPGSPVTGDAEPVGGRPQPFAGAIGEGASDVNAVAGGWAGAGAEGFVPGSGGGQGVPGEAIGSWTSWAEYRAHLDADGPSTFLEALGKGDSGSPHRLSLNFEQLHLPAHDAGIFDSHGDITDDGGDIPDVAGDI